MINGDYCIRIKPVDNGFTVEVPDMEKIKEKEAADKKRKEGGYGVYVGDCTKSYIAKSVAEALKLVKSALAELPEPEMQYSQAFGEADAATPASRG